jgi:Skp family chaperone for outer membrane proteins
MHPIRSLLLCFLPFLTPVAAAQGVGDPADEVKQLRQQVAELSKQLEERKAPKIGVVDIVRVFDELDEKIDMNAEITQIEEKRRSTLRDLIDKAKDLEGKLKVLNPESDEAQETSRQLEDAKSELRAKGRALDEHIYKKLYQFTHSAYEKINREIANYAGEAGYDLVLRLRDPNIEPADAKAPAQSRYVELNRRIEYRSVLFARPALDFTHVIIKRLNERYAREKAARPDAEPATEPEAEE